MRCLELLKAKSPKPEEIAAAIVACERAEPGYKVEVDAAKEAVAACHLRRALGEADETEAAHQAAVSAEGQFHMLRLAQQKLYARLREVLQQNRAARIKELEEQAGEVEGLIQIEYKELRRIIGELIARLTRIVDGENDFLRSRLIGRLMRAVRNVSEHGQADELLMFAPVHCAWGQAELVEKGPEVTDPEERLWWHHPLDLPEGDLALRPRLHATQLEIRALQSDLDAVAERLIADARAAQAPQEQENVEAQAAG